MKHCNPPWHHLQKFRKPATTSSLMDLLSLMTFRKSRRSISWIIIIWPPHFLCPPVTLFLINRVNRPPLILLLIFYLPSQHICMSEHRRRCEAHCLPRPRPLHQPERNQKIVAPLCCSVDLVSTSLFVCCSRSPLGFLCSSVFITFLPLYRPKSIVLIWKWYKPRAVAVLAPVFYTRIYPCRSRSHLGTPLSCCHHLIFRIYFLFPELPQVQSHSFNLQNLFVPILSKKFLLLDLEYQYVSWRLTYPVYN